MKNSKNSTRNDCREAGPGVPGDRGLRGPWEPGDPGPDQRGTRTDADIQNHILRVPMPGDRVSGMEVEVRRARPDDPDPGVGRHLRGDGEGTTVRGEERKVCRSGRWSDGGRLDKVRNVRVSRVEQSLMNAIAAADFPKSRKVTAPRAGYFTSSGHFVVVKHETSVSHIFGDF